MLIGLVLLQEDLGAEAADWVGGNCIVFCHPLRWPILLLSRRWCSGMRDNNASLRTSVSRPTGVNNTKLKTKYVKSNWTP